MSQALENARKMLQDLFRTSPDERNPIMKLLTNRRIGIQREDYKRRAERFMIYSETYDKLPKDLI